MSYLRVSDPSFEAIEGLSHGFFGKDGVDPALFPADQIIQLNQVHGAKCLTRQTIQTHWPEADAQVTDQPGIALAIRTADCAPVLFYGTKSDGTPVIGAAHAGWKGALGGVCEATIKAMEDLGTQKIKATIGPCIARVSYEVDLKFVQNFADQDPDSDDFFFPAQREDHFMFDLPGYVAARLARAGLRSIGLCDRDTYTAPGDFWSYRRATHEGVQHDGRQLSVVMIR